MGHLKLAPLFMVLDAGSSSGFVMGLLKGLGAPQSAEGWGVVLGSVVLFMGSQMLQGRLTARRMRQLKRELVSEVILQFETRKKAAADAVSPS